MPLMQFSTLVLPAPFGPISASSSRASTCNDTSFSTVRPPKRSERCSTASSAMGTLRSGRMPQRAIAAALLAGRLPEIGRLDFAPATQLGGGALQHDAAILDHVAVVGDGQRHPDILLHQQDGDAELASDLRDAPCQILD